jgi:Integrase core domain
MDRVGPRSPRRFVRSCFVLPEITRVGATSGSSESSQASVNESRRQQSQRSSGKAYLSPAGSRAQLSWHEFLHAHAASIIACDFFTVETLWRGRLYVLFFIELRTRRVHFAGCSANPDGLWTTQQARQLAWSFAETPTPIRFLIHDRDSKFSRAFDEVFKSERVEIIRTPFRAPNANVFAERWVGTIRRDCLDWLLIASRRQLEHVLRVYIEHYNTHRPHRALGLRPPTRIIASTSSARIRPARSGDANASVDSSTNTPEQRDAWIYAPNGLRERWAERPMTAEHRNTRLLTRVGGLA